MWFLARPGQVLILQWDDALEDFAPVDSPDLPPEQRERLAAGVGAFEFDKGLAAYPLEDLEPWQALSHFIDATALARAGLPLGAEGTSCHVVSGDPDAELKADSSRRDLTAYFPGPARTARFSPLADARKAALAAARQRGRAEGAGSGAATGLAGSDEWAGCSIVHGDESDTLELLLRREMAGQPAALMAELQLAFVSFLLLHSLEAFEHWKSLVASLSGARRLARRRPALLHNVVVAMQAQLERAPADWFRDELTSTSFLRVAILDLYHLAHDLRAAPAAGGQARPRTHLFVRRTDEFFKFLRERFGVSVQALAQAGGAEELAGGDVDAAAHRSEPCGAAGAGDDEDGEHELDGMPLVRIPVQRHMPGIDATSRLVCDDDDLHDLHAVGDGQSEDEEEEGPYVEYIIREAPFRRQTAVTDTQQEHGAGPRTHGGRGHATGDAASGGVAGEGQEEEGQGSHSSVGVLSDTRGVQADDDVLTDVFQGFCAEQQAGAAHVGAEEEKGLVLEGPCVAPEVDTASEGPLEVDAASEDGDRLGERPPSHTNREMDGHRKAEGSLEHLQAAFKFGHELRHTLGAARGEGGGRGGASGGAERDDGCDAAHADVGAGGGEMPAVTRIGMSAGAGFGLGELLDKPEAVREGSDGMVLDLRERGVSKLMVAGAEPSAADLRQLEDLLHQPVRVEQVSAGASRAARDSGESGCEQVGAEEQWASAVGPGSPAGSTVRSTHSEAGIVAGGEAGSAGSVGVEVGGVWGPGGAGLAGQKVQTDVGRGESSRPAGTGKGNVDYSRFAALEVSEDDADQAPYSYALCQRCRVRACMPAFVTCVGYVRACQRCRVRACMRAFVTCVRKRAELPADTKAHAGTHMHTQFTAQGPRPANLEIIDEEATVVEHVCQQCYEATPDTPVTKPRRMPWMVEPPEW